jgi:hypothetical protein
VHDGGAEVGREARCPWCKQVFFVCRGCDQGQVYCLPEHRDAARRETCRRSKAVHQASPEGRDDHRDHNLAYRKRRKEARLAAASGVSAGPMTASRVPSVTEHPAAKLPSLETLVPAESAPVATTTTAQPSAGEGLDEYDDREAVRG